MQEMVLTGYRTARNYPVFAGVSQNSKYNKQLQVFDYSYIT